MSAAARPRGSVEPSGEVPSHPRSSAEELGVAAAGGTEPPGSGAEVAASERHRVRVGRMYPNSRRRLMKRFVHLGEPSSARSSTAEPSARDASGASSVSVPVVAGAVSLAEEGVHSREAVPPTASGAVCAPYGGRPAFAAEVGVVPQVYAHLGALPDGLSHEPVRLVRTPGTSSFEAGRLEVVGCACTAVRISSRGLVVHSF